MKKITVLAASIILMTTMAACGEKPMTEVEQAAMYNLSLEEFREQKQAAARMNMKIEDHLNMGHGSHEGM